MMEKVIQVHCSNCGWINEKETEFLDISEDIQGADILTFKCLTCGEKNSSRRYG